MKSIKIKTITISLPEKMGKEIQEIAEEEDRTVSELLRESFRQYKAQRTFKKLVQKGKIIAKKKGLTQKDFGGSFEE